MHQLAYEQTKKEFSEDLNKSICALEDITGKKVKIYRAPGFSVKKQNIWVFEELIKNGIEIDCSIFPAKRAHGGLPSYGESKPSMICLGDKRLKEFPINTFNLVGMPLIFTGGGYFRLLPFPIIKSLIKRSDYNMTYFHPRDFDPQQPIIKDLSLLRKFKSYYGLNNAFQKLEQLISAFDFTDLKEAHNSIDWSVVKRVKF